MFATLSDWAEIVGYLYHRLEYLMDGDDRPSEIFGTVKHRKQRASTAHRTPGYSASGVYAQRTNLVWNNRYTTCSQNAAAAGCSVI